MEQELSGMKSSINQEISALEHKEFELMRTMKAAKAQKAKSEMELDYETKHNDRLSNKLNKMERQYKSIETASSDYAQAAKKFESSTSTDVQKKKSAIDTCLISIESYLNISL
jgi:chromosome segregation ATPase